MHRIAATIKKILSLQGVNCTYKSVVTGTYNVDTGTVTNTEVTASVKTYPKVLKASQNYYPNLIGKQAVTFYFDAADIAPKLEDYIHWNSEEYRVQEVTPYVVNGQVVLYKVIGVK
jgi:hypothetical protein